MASTNVTLETASRRGMLSVSDVTGTFNAKPGDIKNLLMDEHVMNMQANVQTKDLFDANGRLRVVVLGTKGTNGTVSCAKKP